MTTARESAIVRSIRRYLDGLAPAVYYEKRWGGPYGRVGAPDLSLCVRGRRVELEVKNADGQPTKAQRAELAKWQAAGAVVGVVRSADDVRAIVEQIGEMHRWESGE